MLIILAKDKRPAFLFGVKLTSNIRKTVFRVFRRVHESNSTNQHSSYVFLLCKDAILQALLFAVLRGVIFKTYPTKECMNACPEMSFVTNSITSLKLTSLERSLNGLYLCPIGDTYLQFSSKPISFAS